jgi:hypothetical protein
MIKLVYIIIFITMNIYSLTRANLENETIKTMVWELIPAQQTPKTKKLFVIFM